jgi:hypothetical protein
MAAEARSDGNGHLTRLMGGILSDAEDLAQSQMELFRCEAKQDLRTAIVAGVSVLGGAIVAVLGIILVLLMLVHLLAWAAPSLPLWACYAIVGLPILALGAGAAWFGVRSFLNMTPPFKRSIQAVGDNLRWLTRSR